MATKQPSFATRAECEAYSGPRDMFWGSLFAIAFAIAFTAIGIAFASI